MSTDITSDPVFATPAPEDKKSADSILQAPRPEVTRFKRSAIMAGASVFAGLVGFGMIYAFVLDGPKKPAPTEQPENLLQKQKPQFDDKLPTNYSDAAAYGPGNASLPPPGSEEATGEGAAGAQNAPQPVRPAPGYAQRPQMTPAQERRARARELAIQQEMAARSGSIMFSGGGFPSGGGSSMGQDDGGYTAPRPRQPSYDDGASDDNQQQIATSRFGEDDYVQGKLEAARSRYEIKAGAIISGALLTALNSDLPGEVVATVTENVYDHVTGRYLLIPQGARLFGKYDNKVGYKQNRAMIAWSRIIFPNGSSINIGQMTGTDGTGASGLRDRVNNHFGGLFSGIALSTAIAIGAAAAEGAGTQDDQLVTAGGGAVSQEASRVGGRIVERELSRSPTITVRAGFRVKVLVNKDIILEPYRGARTRSR